MKKWNVKEKKYEEFNSPAKRIKLLSNDMNEVIDCTECGKEIFFGDCYTSKLIHNDNGFGYPVCEDCYDKELEKYV